MWMLCGTRLLLSLLYVSDFFFFSTFLTSMSKVFLLLQKGLSERENDLQVFQQICFTKYFSNRQTPVMTFSSITFVFLIEPIEQNN
jgi:hypothetical protein